MFRLNRNKQKTNRNSLIESIFWYFYEKVGLFRFVSKQFVSVVLISIPKPRVSMFRLNRNKQKTNRNCWYFSENLGLNNVKCIHTLPSFPFVSVDLLFVSVQSKHRNSLFRYRSETTETNVLFRIVPKLVSVPVSVVSNRN